MISAYEEEMVVPTIASESTEVDVTQSTKSDVAEPTAARVTAPAPVEGSSTAVARLLEIAARNADQLLAEAQAEADKMKADARNEAEQVLSEARSESEKVRAELENSRNQANDEIAKLRETSGRTATGSASTCTRCWRRSRRPPSSDPAQERRLQEGFPGGRTSNVSRRRCSIRTT